MHAGEFEADALFDGGGLKGIAIAGALLEFGDRGHRTWVKVAGVSFGAVIAAYLASGRGEDELVGLLRATSFRRFLDWSGHLLPVRRIASGKYFRDWVDEQLGGATFASIGGAGNESRLRILASDITSDRIMLIPDDLPRYSLPGRSDPLEAATFPIADAVRMSMAIPNLFEPVELLDRETGKPATIVDGSVRSNFPIEIFDRPGPPKRPTIGFRLVGSETADGFRLEGQAAGLGWLSERADAIRFFEGSDPRELPIHVRARACLIPVSHVTARDFDLSIEQQNALIEAGRKAAADFLGYPGDSPGYTSRWG